MNKIIYIGVLLLLWSGSLYGEDCNITKIQQSSIGTTITHKPKRSPVGEYITITVEKKGFDFTKAWYDVKFCFNPKEIVYSKDVEVKEITGSSVVLSVQVPKIENMPRVHRAKPVDIVVVIKDADNTHIEVTTHKFKLSSRPLAIIFWLSALFIPWFIASRVSAVRSKTTNCSKFNPIWFVSGDNDKASLSLTQILIWTMLVFSASFYVLEVSGKLLDLTDDILILLGITGGVSLIANISSSTNSRENDKVNKEKITPKWIDLFQSDGRADLFRVQMALFTVLAVIFVTGQIYNELVFPEFPEGLLILIGISNGVYLGSKGAKKIKNSGEDK